MGMPPHKTYTTHTLEKNTALLYMPQLMSQYTSQPHTTQPQYTNQLQYTTQPQFTSQLQYTTQLQLMVRDQSMKKDQLYTNTDMLSMMIMLTPTSKPTKPVTDMPPTVNTVSTFLMVVPKLSPTT